MCRMFGFVANQPTAIAWAVLDATNSLICQSRCDFQGKAHPDGWGVGYYEQGLPRVTRGLEPAGSDLRLAELARKLQSRAVIAHVRLASVGSLQLENTHPFTYGRWLFAHNGTIYGFDQVAPRLEQELLPHLAAARRGTTDSELIFYFLLSRLTRAGVDVEATQAGDEAERENGLLLDVTRATLADLEAWGAGADPKTPAALNLLITDGRRILATRQQRSLFWTQQQTAPSCATHGTKHVTAPETVDYRAVWIASEPLGREPGFPEAWHEVPERGVLLADARGQVTWAQA